MNPYPSQPQQHHHHGYGQPQQAPMMQAPQASAQNTPFKFTFVRGGNAATVFAKDGMMTPQGLVLDGMHLPLACILDTETVQRRIVLKLGYPQAVHPSIQGFMEQDSLVIEVRSPAARMIEIAIDRFASYAEAEGYRQQLAAQGREREFWVVACPFCQSTVNLSTLPRSGYYYCRFCTSIHHHQQPLPQTTKYRTCDECSMFDRNQTYSEFYFYFLVVVYGFRYVQRQMCDTCAKGLFWKTFLINFIFVLGVPSAVWIRVKLAIGREPSLQKLADANGLALKGNAQGARAIFAELHQILPDHPGLHVNEARGHAQAGDVASATASLRAALAACPNYVPATDLMQKLHAALPPGQGAWQG